MWALFPSHRGEEYILFCDVEHYGADSAPGISSHRFYQYPESLPIHSWNPFPSIPTISGVRSNFLQFRFHSMPEFREFDGTGSAMFNIVE
jgi:hypothetical protein